MDGLHGDFPETAWIIDYPLFERIHYLLVAGFDVYGNAGHQLNTRIVMDFLRMEGENNFLAFLPVEPAQDHPRQLVPGHSQEAARSSSNNRWTGSTWSR